MPAEKSVAAQMPRSSAADAKAARIKFAQGVIARGEAVPAGQPLPPGATHEIVGTDAAGAPVLKRNRFSIS